MILSASHLVKTQPKYAWMFAGGSGEHLEMPTFPELSVFIDQGRREVF